MKSLFSINKYLLKYKYRLGLGALFVIIGTWFSVESVPYVRMAINAVAQHLEQKSPILNDTQPVVKEVLYCALMILLMTLLNGLFMFLKRQTLIVMSRWIENDMKNEIFEHYQKLDLGFYKRNNTGDLMNRISEDVGRVRMYVGPAIMYIIDTITAFVLTIFAMVKVNTLFTVYVLAPLPLLILIIYWVSDAINKRSTKVQEQLSDLSTISQETFSGIRILRAFGKEQLMEEKFSSAAKEYKKRQLSLVKADALFQPTMIFMIGLSSIICVYTGGVLVSEGKISVGHIAEFVVYISKLTWPIASLGWVITLIQRAAASQVRINEFLHTVPAINPQEGHKDMIKGDIEFKNVSLVYPDTGIKAVNNISFKVKSGMRLGIIGKTGSGKSTVANLLCRLYDTTEGQILVDGKDIKTFAPGYLRGQMGYVPQEVFLFSDTIHANIAFTSAVNVNKQQVEQAAKDADIYSNIMEFPEGFQTIVGERGITLSGGQKQRISIARAIAGAPQVLIFDDCLSAVDTETEENILNNLQNVMKDKTAIIISHRVSSFKTANHIIVLEDGQIVEEGTHEYLIAKRGYYAGIYNKQLTEAK